MTKNPVLNTAQKEAKEKAITAKEKKGLTELEQASLVEADKGGLIQLKREPESKTNKEAKHIPQTSIAAELIEAKKTIAVLERKFELAFKRAEAANPIVQVKYKGKKPDFIYKKYDFSKGTCEMLNSEAAILVKRDSKCFGIV